MNRLWCIITRHHDWRDAGDHYQACHRCPEIKRLPREPYVRPHP